jgi:hypothetical protein
LKLKAVYRITTFVPPEHLDNLLAGILKVSPLKYGRYDQVVWYSAPGTEQFRPLAGSNPTVGKENVLERIGSVKLEFAIPRDQQLLHRLLIEGIAANHPWEEPVVYVTETIVAQLQPDDPSIMTEV